MRNRLAQYWPCVACCLVAVTLAAPAFAQVPADAASDRRLGDFIYFMSFAQPSTPFKALDSVGKIRSDSSEYFSSELATCDVSNDTCDANNVYELADRFCQALEFHEAATWRVSENGDELVLHWTVCGLKK